MRTNRIVRRPRLGVLRRSSLVAVLIALAGCGGGGGGGGGSDGGASSCTQPCVAPTAICDETAHLCVACLRDADCPAGAVCGQQGGVPACVSGCRAKADCVAAGMPDAQCCG